MIPGSSPAAEVRCRPRGCRRVEDQSRQRRKAMGISYFLLVVTAHDSVPSPSFTSGSLACHPRGCPNAVGCSQSLLTVPTNCNPSHGAVGGCLRLSSNVRCSCSPLLSTPYHSLPHPRRCRRYRSICSETLNLNSCQSSSRWFP